MYSETSTSSLLSEIPSHSTRFNQLWDQYEYQRNKPCSSGRSLVRKNFVFEPLSEDSRQNSCEKIQAYVDSLAVGLEHPDFQLSMELRPGPFPKSDFYEVCKGLELARNFQFPVLREPPQSFLATMEEYIREAPRMVSVPAETLDYPERLMLTYKPEEEEDTEPQEDANSPVDEAILESADNVDVSNDDLAPAPPPPPPTFNSRDPDDLLGLNFDAPNASSIEENNALALAIIPTDGVSNGAGGLDSLTLNSLYDDGAYRASQQPIYRSPAPNPFESADPFASHQPNPFGSYQPPATYAPPQPNLMTAPPPNPFVDSGFGPFPSAKEAVCQKETNWKYNVLYVDGDEEILNLKTKKWEILEEFSARDEEENSKDQYEEEASPETYCQIKRWASKDNESKENTATKSTSQKNSSNSTEAAAAASKEHG
ncbi:hypothetical protein L2E82_41761 [Cichorium intybus]|uniref:Uncharacterized protein n=1 Tax=Cichorium intybus TaxID=13427 RepID=A0ACB8ZKZ8_CICIN|nr:hypothetical protein L2E82_41761 [Cichorium intybus]